MKKKPVRSKKKVQRLPPLIPHQHILTLIIFILAVFVFGLAAFLYSRLYNNANAVTVKPAGSYTDVTWPKQNYTVREWDFTPITDTPEAYFWSYQQGFMNGDGFYVGMQGATEGKQKLLLFSVWNALGASADGTNGSWCQTFGGEGVGYSCRRNYEWVGGRTYHFRVKKVSDGWWGTWMKDTVTQKEVFLGKIHIPSSWGNLSATSVIFTEYFAGDPMQKCQELAYAKGKWDNFISDSSSKPKNFSPHITQNNCDSNSKVTKDGTGYIHEMGIAAKGKGLSAVYYNNMDFTGTKVSRIDETINFPSWGNKAPVRGIGPDSFSVRWNGMLTSPSSGNYTFYASVDDGVRVWVNNTKVIDRWSQQRSEVSGTITLEKGKKYPIRIDYFEKANNQKAVLRWKGPGVTKARIPSYYLSPN